MNEKVLIIDRSKWRRGGDVYNITHGSTALLNDHGLMCCLGFDALACGVSVRELAHIGDPAELTMMVYELPPDYMGSRLASVAPDDFDNAPIVLRAIKVNDDAQITDAEREAKLIPILKQLGWDDVRFVDGAA